MLILLCAVMYYFAAGRFGSVGIARTAHNPDCQFDENGCPIIDTLEEESTQERAEVSKEDATDARITFDQAIAALAAENESLSTTKNPSL